MSLPLIAITWAIISLTSLIAIRMVRAAALTRSLPETLLAIFFGGGVAGYALIMLPQSFEFSDAGILIITKLSQTVLTLPAITVVFFTWQVFRHDRMWACVAAWSIATFTFGSVILGRWLAVPLGLETLFSLEPGTPFYWITTGVRAAGFAWSCVEASIFYGKAKKQHATGLLNAMVANRFLLWAIWSGAATSMVLLRVISGLLMGSNPRGVAMPVPLILLMFVASVCCVGAVWLTFAPPKVYQRLIEGAAPSTA